MTTKIEATISTASATPEEVAAFKAEGKEDPVESRTLMVSAAGDSATVPAAPQLPVAFESASLEALYKQVEAEVTAELPDIETQEGRTRIKSLAAKISSSKTAIDKPIRDHLRAMKAIPKILEVNARENVERFDALRDKTLKPLLDASAPQEATIARMAEILTACDNVAATSVSVRNMLGEVEAVDITTFWPENKKKATAAVDGARQVATASLARIEAAEKQAAELEELRIKQAENELRERDRLIADAAAQKAREEEHQRSEQRILDERNKAEQSRMAQLKAEKDAKDNEARRIAQEEQNKRDREEAERQAEMRAKQAAQQAAKYAAEQTALEAQRLQEEADRRAADKAHRTKINREALVCLITNEEISKLIPDEALRDALAKAVITAVAKGEVSNMKVIY